MHLPGYLIITMTAVLIFFGSFSCTRDMITTDEIGREINRPAMAQADDLPEDISGPYLFIPERDFDFGYTFQHSKVSHKFRFYSAGDDTLRILKIRPGWGCTKAPLEKDVLAPGETVDLEVIFLTHTYFGHQYKVPVITTNEPKPNYIRKVGVIADVVVNPDSTYPIVFRPHVLDFYRNGESGREKIPFDIINVSEETVEMKFVDFPGELIEVRLPRVIKGGKTSTGYVYLKPQAVDEEFEKSFTIELMDEDATRFTLPVRRIKPTKKD